MVRLDADRMGFYGAVADRICFYGVVRGRPHMVLWWGQGGRLHVILCCGQGQTNQYVVWMK